MQVRIRLQRLGKSTKNKSNYRIVAISKSNKRDGRHLELLGYYDPARNPAVYSLKTEKIQQWVDKGAQMSQTVNSLVKKVKKTNTNN